MGMGINITSPCLFPSISLFKLFIHSKNLVDPICSYDGGSTNIYGGTRWEQEGILLNVCYMSQQRFSSFCIVWWNHTQIHGAKHAYVLWFWWNLHSCYGFHRWQHEQFLSLRLSKKISSRKIMCSLQTSRKGFKNGQIALQKLQPVTFLGNNISEWKIFF